MKALLLTALTIATVIAAPVAAQTTPQPPVPEAQTGIPNTALSNSPTPSTGPRAQQSNQSPSNNVAATANTDPAQPAPPPPPADATVIVEPPVSPAEAMPAPAPLAHYPICKANQFDKCMEPGPRRSASKRSSRRR